MCVTACPVNINTGDLVRRLRMENHSALADRAWNAAAKSWGLSTRLVSTGLSAAKVMPTILPKTATELGRVMLGAEHVPQYNELLPTGGTRRPQVSDANPEVVFFPACVSMMFGPPENQGLSASEAFLTL